MLSTELCCGSIRGNSDPTVTFIALGFFGVFIVILVLLRNANVIGGKAPRRPVISDAVIDGTEISVIDQARLSEMTAAPNTGALAMDGSVVDGQDGPARVIVQVRSALLARQLDSVRHLLSDELYQRLSASLPTPWVPSVPRLFMFTNQHSGDDPNRVVVQVPGRVAVPEAIAENWTMVRGSQSVPDAASWIVDDISNARPLAA